MAVISLPLSFNNSFWTQDYRTGLEVLFHKLEQGVAENDEIIAFFRARAIAEGNLAASLRNPIPTTGAGFHADDGASLLTAFRGIQAESLEQAKAHEAVAKDLHTLVADPFQQWAQGHKDKLRQAKNVALEGLLRSYEYSREDVHKLKDQYLTKVRRADEAEDDARLVSSEISDKYTNSPRLSPRDQHKGPTRQPTVSERITQRLRDLGRSTTTATNTSDAGERQKSEQVFDAESEKSPSKMDKGKGRAADQEAVLASSPPPLSPPLPPTLSIVPPPDPEPVLLAGFPFAPTAVARFLTQAKGELPLRPVRFPILGEYQDCFSGEEFVTWLRENVQAFDRNLDLAAAAAKDLTEREDLLRRLGEFGNAFENANDSFYQFRPKAFTFGQPHVAKSPTEVAPSPIVKTSSNFVNIVSKALASGPSEPPFVRSRREAETADIDYRDSVRKLDRQRLGLEERIEDILKALQKWESERLRTIQTVLHQYQGSIASFRKGYDSSVERSATLVSSYNPDSDLKALIERYRTGPFRPTPHTYESVAHDELDVVFGIDLRKWAEGGWSTVTGEEEKKDQVPPMLLTLLNALKDRYEKIQDDAEKRKIWIYEVPLTAVHHLRESLNAVPAGQDIPEDLLNKYDPPVIAASVKLWMLELDPPLGMYDGWDDVRKLYPQVGAIKPEGEVSQQQHFEAVQSALQKLPKVHLSVIDVIIHHFKELIDKTKSDESNEVYLAKLALAIGRGIIRPKHENEISIHDRHPTLFFIDLVEHYDKLLPPTIEKKKRESERKVPTRRRTKIVDMRMRRSNLSDTSDLKEIIVAQHHAKSPPSSLKSPPASRASFSSSSAPTVAPAPERIKVQAPVAVLPKNHGLPSALRPAHVGTNGTPSPPAFLPPPPPPPLMAPPPPSAVVPPPPHIIAPPPPPPIKVQDPATPPRPTFKEPPPELDNLPPRPMFKEPPPEFEDEDEQRIRTPQMSPKIASPQPSSPSRSASPATSLSRATSAGRVRGPRTTRGPRAATGTNRRESFGPSPPSPSPSHPVTRGHVRTGSRGSNTPTNRRSGSASSFSRRTMASDAEDDVVNK